MALAMFPLGTVLLPGAPLRLQIFEPRYVEMIRRETAFGVVLISRGSEVGGHDERNDVGTLARIESRTDLPGNRFALSCRGAGRIRVVRWLADDPYPRAETEPWPDVPDGDETEPRRSVIDKRSEMVELWQRLSGRAVGSLLPDRLDSFELAAGLPISDADAYRALCAPGPVARLHVLADALDDVIASLRFRLQ